MKNTSRGNAWYSDCNGINDSLQNYKNQKKKHGQDNDRNFRRKVMGLYQYHCNFGKSSYFEENYDLILNLCNSHGWNPKCYTPNHATSRQESYCHLLRIVISFRRFSHTSRRHNPSCFQYSELVFFNLLQIYVRFLNTNFFEYVLQHKA